MVNVVIIGAGATGMAVASKLARESSNFLIHVFQSQAYISFAACAIPYYVANDFEDSDLLNVRTTADFQDEKDFKSKIMFYLKTQVKTIDFDNNNIKYCCDDDQNSTKAIQYDYLVIATGAKPQVVKPFTNITEISNIFTVNSKEDAINIKNFVKNITKIAIIGGSYIGLEMAETFLKLQKEVTIIEKQPRILANIVDNEFSDLVYQEITCETNGRVAKKARVILNSTVSDIILNEDNTRIAVLKLDNNAVIPCELVILATGIVPNSAFVSDQNVKLTANGAIIINKYGQVLRKTPNSTPYQNVFSAGDCATVINKTNQNNIYIALATTASKLARVIANNIQTPASLVAFPGTLGASILRVKQLEIASCGGINIIDKDVASVFVKATDIPTYFNEAKPLYLKIYYDKKTYQIKAAQMAGYNRAVLRINALAVAIWKQMDVRELQNLDFVYAPPFSTTADIIHLAARKIK